MVNTPGNASVWANADVYIAPIGTAPPATISTAFSASWNAVGILDGGDGIEEARSLDIKDFSGWGVGVIAQSRKNFKLTVKFSVLEDNTYVRSLVWPGSTASSIVVPTVAPVLMAFETYSGGKKLRRITAGYALVDVDGGIKDSEEDLTKRSLIATIFPTSGGVLFTRQYTPDIASIAITPLTLTLTLAGANIKTLVATATYTDATTGDITDQATWITSNAAKATVWRGYVTGVAAGTANVSCQFGGVTSTAPCVVTVS